MLAEALAVIGGDDHDCAIELAGGFQIVEQCPDHRIGVGDFRVVGLVLRRVRFRCAVGLVRVIQMDPREPLRVAGCGLRIGLWIATCRLLIDPRRRGSNDFFGPSFGSVRGVPSLFLSVTIVVDVEPAIEAEAGVEDEGADERARAVAGGFHDRRQRRQRRTEAEQTVGAQPVDRW